MKNLNIYLTFTILAFVTQNIHSQMLTNAAPQDGYNNNNVFLDASTNFDPDITTDNDNGKGLLFPRTDLTQWSWLLDDMNNGGGATLPTAYDGMIVYNTGTGNTPTGGNNPTVSSAVEPGFYYFSNPTVDPNNFSPTISNGQWLPLGSNAARISVVSNEINETTTIINTTPEKVVLLNGTAGGSRTELVLDNTVLAPSTTTIRRLREAKIYDASDNLLLIASGNISEDTLNDEFILTTGDGMINKLLPSGSYEVELYFE